MTAAVRRRGAKLAHRLTGQQTLAGGCVKPVEPRQDHMVAIAAVDNQ
jgi:hypothetical protein